MSDNRLDLPAVSATNFSQRVREAMMVYLGRQGDPLDRGVTLRDLIDSGLVSIADGYKIGAGITPVLVPETLGVPGPQGPPGPTGPAGTYEPDLTAPPTPTGFIATGALFYVLVEHDTPVYTQGHGHLRTWLYGATRANGAPQPTFNDAVVIAQFSGPIYAMPSDPGVEWHLWIKWETVDNVLSVSPAGGTNGVVATTGTDPAPLLELLIGHITESHLFTSLAERIDLIDGGGIGSVNDRIQIEVGDRIAALAAEANARELADGLLGNSINGISGGLATTAADLVNEASIRQNALSIISGAIDVLGIGLSDNTSAIVVERYERTTVEYTTAGQVTHIASVAGDNAAALVAEQYTRASADGAAAGQTTSLAAAAGETAASLVVEQTVRASADGAAAGQVTSLASATGENAAALVLEQDARTTADSAVSTQTLALAASVGDNVAALVVEQVARATADDATAGQTTTLVSAVGDNAAAIKTEQLVRTTADDATAQQTTSLSTAVGNNSAAIVTEQLARTTDDSSTASQVVALQAVVGENTAGILSEQTVRATTDSAYASQVNGMVAVVGDVSAGLLSEQTVRSDEDAAMSGTIQTLTASVGDNAAAIVTEQGVRAADDAALAFDITTLQASRAAVFNQRGIPTALSTAGDIWINAGSANRFRNSTGDADVSPWATNTDYGTVTTAAGTAPDGTNTAQLWVEDSTPSVGRYLTQTPNLNPYYEAGKRYTVSVYAKQYETGDARHLGIVLSSTPFGGVYIASAFNLATGAVANSASGAAGAARTHGCKAVGNGWYLCWVSATAQSTVSTDGAQFRLSNSATSAWPTYSGTGNSGIYLWGFQCEEITDGNDTPGWHIPTSGTVPVSTVGTKSLLLWNGTWWDPADNAEIAALRIEANARASENGTLLAQYTVKTDLAGFVSGFGLASEAPVNENPTSTFGVRADKFFVAPPTNFSQEAEPTTSTVGHLWYKPSTKETKRWNGSSWVAYTVPLPFYVQTTDTTINGVPVPAGTYINGAYIMGGTITGSSIAASTIEGSKLINVTFNHLEGGSLKVGSYMQSTNYVGGTSGWRIDADGTAEFGAATIRGQLTAGQLVSDMLSSDNVLTRGLTVRDGSGNIILASDTNLDFSRINPSNGWLNTSLASATNLVYNGDFSAGWDGWSGFITNNQTVADSGINQMSAWALNPMGEVGNGTAWWQTNARVGDDTYYSERHSPKIPVKVGGRYCVSAYTGAHRAEVVVFCYFYDNTDTVIGYSTWDANGSNNEEAAGGPTLAGYKRCFVLFTAPANTLYVRVVLRKYDTKVGQSNSFLFAARVMLEEVGSTATGPGAWAPAGFIDQTAVRATNRIDNTNISTYIAAAAIELAHIKTASITNLAALSSYLGYVTIDATGWLRGGQTDYATGAGFFLGYSGGTYKFSIGDANQYMRWTGTALEIKLNKVTLSTTTPAGGSFAKSDTITRSLGTATVTASGGTPPYTYSWTYTWERSDGYTPTAFDVGYATFSSNVATYYARANSDCIISVTAACTVTDANGLTATIGATGSGTFGTGPP